MPTWTPRDLAPGLERLVVAAGLWVVLFGFAVSVMAALRAWIPVVGAAPAPAAVLVLGSSPSPCGPG